MTSMQPVSVLVTSAGSMPAAAVIQALRHQDEIPVRVVAVDAQGLSIGFYLADCWHVVPMASDPDFISTILEICHREQVRVVFPIIDEELPVFATHLDVFTSHGIRVISNSLETVQIARDKYKTYQFCLEHDIPVPRTWLPEELNTVARLSFPLVVKPRSGRGTADVHRVFDEDELRFWLARVPNPIVQQFIEGQEYTIDVLGDLNGRVLSVVPKKRLLIRAGMQVKGQTVKDNRLIEYGCRVAEVARLTPRANFQCIASDSGIFLIELNPKFPASLPLTVAAGVNAPLLLLKMHLGQAVPNLMGQFEDGLVMLRCWQEVFVRGAGVGAERGR